MKKTALLLFLVVLLVLVSCASTGKSDNPYDAGLNLADGFLSTSVLTNFQSKNGRVPVVVIGLVSSSDADDTQVKRGFQNKLVASGLIDLIISSSERDSLREERIEQLNWGNIDQAKALANEMVADYFGRIFITPYGQSYLIAADIVEVETGKVVWSDQYDQLINLPAKTATTVSTAKSESSEQKTNAAVLESISLNGQMEDQRAFGSIITKNLTVLAKYSDGTLRDVTNKAVFTTDSGRTTWGSCLRYSQTKAAWEIVYDRHYINVSYTENGMTKTLRTNDFIIYAAVEPGNLDNAYVIENKKGSYLLMDIRGHYNGKEPVDYLTNGAKKGTEVWIIFTREEFDKDITINKDRYLSHISDMGVDTVGSSETPPFGIYFNGEEAYTVSIALDGTGKSGKEYVLVAGLLNDDLKPGDGISFSSFGPYYPTCYFIKIK